MRKRLTTFFKIAVTVIGLAYVALNVPVSEVRDTLTDVRWGWILVGFGLVIAGLFVRAFRWLLLLRGLGVSVSFSRLVELYFIGNFFNAFLPSGFGGDVVRVLEVARDVPANIAAGTVIVDRLSGLLMLFVLALLAFPFRPAQFAPELAWGIVLLSIAGLVGGFVLLDGRLLYRFGGWLPAKLSPIGDGPVAKLLQAVQGCGRPAVLGALGVSVVFNLCLVGWWAATGRALGLDVSYAHYLLVVPIMSVALLVPSVSGLGVRESFAPTLFASQNLNSGQAVALSLLVFAIMRVSSLFGAPVYIASTLRQHQAEQSIAEPVNPANPDSQ